MIQVQIHLYFTHLTNSKEQKGLKFIFIAFAEA